MIHDWKPADASLHTLYLQASDLYDVVLNDENATPAHDAKKNVLLEIIQGIKKGPSWSTALQVEA